LGGGLKFLKPLHQLLFSFFLRLYLLIKELSTFLQGGLHVFVAPFIYGIYERSDLTICVEYFMLVVPELDSDVHF
jgi:hypothetical protein